VLLEYTVSSVKCMHFWFALAASAVAAISKWLYFARLCSNTFDICWDLWW